MVDNTHIESLIEKNDAPIKSNAKRDKNNILLLLVLYTLQGLPLGFSLAIPILMQNMNVSFKDQAKFSLAIWPFSLKLLWAPLVDSLFIQKWGRRKSWLIPVQYFLGICFIITGFCINKWLLKGENLQIYPITFMFFILNFLAATQDIIVDGWALTMLKKENISYAAMCNSAGQNFGLFLGYGMLIILISESFWNNWWRTLPAKGGLITLQNYFYIWGILFIIITTLVAIFKSESNDTNEPNAIGLSIIKTYKSLFSIMKLPNIKKLAIILLTIKVSFSSVDAAYKLKLIDGGITKDEIAAVEFLFVPLSISLPILIARFISKEKPLKNSFNIIPYRLLVGIVITVVIYYIPFFLNQAKPLVITYKAILVLLYFLQQLMMYTMMLTSMAFYACISDPKIGGTNMTLLTTISNLGAAGSKTGALWLLEFLTFKKCSNSFTNLCSTNLDKDLCSISGGSCQVIDGFYIETILCTIYGVIWYLIFRKSINYLQSKNVDEWHVEMKIK